jgi:hypothetical protein
MGGGYPRNEKACYAGDMAALHILLAARGYNRFGAKVVRRGSAVWTELPRTISRPPKPVLRTSAKGRT